MNGKAIQRSLYHSVCLFSLMLLSCEHKPEKQTVAEVLNYDWPDTLKVGTLYGPTSYFIYKDEEMGRDYELMKMLGDEKGRVVEFRVAASQSDLLTLAEKGEIDIVAWDMPVISEYADILIPCGWQESSSQVLIQKKNDSEIKDILDLKGKELFVEADSRAYYRLLNLDREIGGGIKITVIDVDSVMPQKLPQMIWEGTVPNAVADEKTARLNSQYYPELSFKMYLSLPQITSWAVRFDKPWLADSINNWFATAELNPTNELTLRKTYERAINEGKGEIKTFTKNFAEGYISPYDSIFKMHADVIGWDWRLFAAIAFAESKFINTVVSPSGARGIMQIMPSTAKAFGHGESSLGDPAKNVELAARILHSIDKSLEEDVPDDQERVKFVVAAYHSGIAHIKDAIAIAHYKGLDAQRWDDNVEEAMRLKSEPEIYKNTDICRYGQFKAGYTLEYVRIVQSLFEKASEHFE